MSPEPSVTWAALSLKEASLQDPREEEVSAHLWGGGAPRGSCEVGEQHGQRVQVPRSRASWLVGVKAWGVHGPWGNLTSLWADVGKPGEPREAPAGASMSGGESRGTPPRAPDPGG